MSAEANKVLYRGMIEAVNSQDAEAWRGAFAEDYVWHGANGFEVEGIEAMREGMEMYWSAMPDFHIDILELVAEGDFVVAREVWSGTDEGGMMGLAATGRRVAGLGAMVMARVSDGKLAEAWEESDVLGMWQQLGVVTLPEPD